MNRLKVAVIGPVYPYRAGIAYCTTRLAEELAKTTDVSIVSFSRQYPKWFYPGGEDIDETLRAKSPRGARFVLDILNPITWIRTGLQLRRERPDAVIFVWWIWVWALPYLVLVALLPRPTRIVMQCHNIGDKEPAWWKRALTNGALRRAGTLVVHAKSEAEDARRRTNAATRPSVVATFLPVHELGGAIPSRAEARRSLGIASTHVALFFGHIRPFKALDLTLLAWSKLKTGDALLLVAGEAWWNSAAEYRKLAADLGLTAVDLNRPLTPGPRPPGGRAVAFDFRFIPDAEIAIHFAAADVVLAPYRIEAQSGVALTAFHFERPVIASTAGGLPELIEPGRNGDLVPPDDPDALARAIDTFFARDDRAIMESAAAESARKHSWEEYARVFTRLLTGVISDQ